MSAHASVKETHEPAEPVNWPHGHVAVTRAGRGEAPAELTTSNVQVVLTDDAAGECMALELADTRHFLHSTTARELSTMLLNLNGQPVTITIHGVEHRAGGAAARTLSKELLARIKEWNRIAVSAGVAPV